MTVGFTDTYDNARLFFLNVLRDRYHVIETLDNPDYLIFGDANFGQNHRNIQAKKKIFFTGENVRPDWSDCDFAITFDHENSSRHYRLPLYVLEMWAITKDNNPDARFSFDFLTKRHYTFDPEKEYESKSAKKKIAYIQSNPRCGVRNIFASYFNSIGELDSAGPHMNNTEFIIPRDRTLKMDFYRNHFFGMAFENGSYPGYVTEKLIDAFYSYTIPIYWGSSTVSRDFNPKAFINAEEFKKADGVYEPEILWKELQAIVENKHRYINILSEHPFNGNILPDVAWLDTFLTWWDTFVL